MPAKTAQLQVRVTPQQKTALRRLARAAGQDVSAYVLSRVVPDERDRFADLIRAIASESERKFALAELNDFLSTLSPTAFPGAVARADIADLPAAMQNYVAAMVEQASAEKGADPPVWVRGVVPLDEPWFATPLRSLRLHLLTSSPAPYRSRNIFVDAGVGSRV